MLWTPLPKRTLRIGLQYGPNKIEYQDYDESTIHQAGLDAFLMSFVIPGLGSLIGMGDTAALVRSVIYLTTTSVSNQTWTKISDWNNSANQVEVCSAGGGSAPESNDDCGAGRGDGSDGGSGGYAKQTNITVAGSTATYAVRAGGSGAGTGAAHWFNGTTLALSSVGQEGGSNGITGHGAQAGAITATAIGSTIVAGNTSAGTTGVSPPAQAQTARASSTVTTAGDGQGWTGGLGAGQGLIVITNNP